MAALATAGELRRAPRKVSSALADEPRDTATHLAESVEVPLIELGAAKAGEERVELAVEEADGVADEADDSSEDGGDSLASSSEAEADEVVALEKGGGVELREERARSAPSSAKVTPRLSDAAPSIRNSPHHQ